jgi:hypothetical protein
MVSVSVTSREVLATFVGGREENARRDDALWVKEVVEMEDEGGAVEDLEAKNVEDADKNEEVGESRLGRFQAVGFSHPMDIAVVCPDGVVLHYPFVCCPALWWNYLRLSAE